MLLLLSKVSFYIRLHRYARRTKGVDKNKTDIDQLKKKIMRHYYFTV